MNCIMTVEGRNAVIQFDSGTGVLRGESVGLNGGTDFTPRVCPGFGAKVPSRSPCFSTSAAKRASSLQSVTRQFQVRVPEDAAAS